LSVNFVSSDLRYPPSCDVIIQYDYCLCNFRQCSMVASPTDVGQHYLRSRL